MTAETMKSATQVFEERKALPASWGSWSFTGGLAWLGATLFGRLV